jgi:hypothetical protein
MIREQFAKNRFTINALTVVHGRQKSPADDEAG